MTAPDDSVRKVIGETIGPRIADHQTYLAAAVPNPIPIARADLVYLWDDYHTEYLDWASLGNPVGHAHPIVVRSTSEHYRYYGHTAPQGQHVQRWPVQYAKDLSDQFTGQGEAPRKVLFTEGEREAVVQAAHLAVRNTTFTAASPSYQVMTVGGDYDWLPTPRTYYPPSFDPADADWGRACALLLNMADSQAHTIRPGQARRWILAAREAGKPVIVDETITGFGRLGVMWAHQSTGLSPDVVVLGGAAGGGFPLGAVVASPDFFGDAPIDVSSQSGNPVACCAGASTLTAVSLGVLEYMAESNVILDVGLRELLSQFGEHLAGHHGWGHLRGLRLRSPELAARLVADARALGLHLAPAVGTTVVLAPVLITSTNEITRGIDTLASVFMAWDEQRE